MYYYSIFMEEYVDNSHKIKSLARWSKKVNDVGIVFVLQDTQLITTIEVGIVLILQMEKLRPRKVKKFVERCKTSSTANLVLLHNDTNHVPFN